MLLARWGRLVGGWRGRQEDGEVGHKVSLMALGWDRGGDAVEEGKGFVGCVCVVLRGVGCRKR